MTQHQICAMNRYVYSKDKTKIANQRFGAGFTIIEFMVYIAILAILGGATSALFLWTLQAHTKSRVLQETSSAAKVAMDRMIHEVREAESLYLPTSSATQISLETKTFMPPGETSGYIDFFLCDKALCMKKEEAAPIALTSSSFEVTGLSFTTISTNTNFPSLQIAMTVKHKNPSGSSQLEAVLQLTSTASLR